MRRALWVGGVLAIALAVARADEQAPVPYRLWWSFPNDDDTAIEIDEPDLSVSTWASRWKFAKAMQHCDLKRSKVLSEHRDGTPVREIKIESIDPDGKVFAVSRCVMTLKSWRTRIGLKLVERLDGELDAHAAFLVPRRVPGKFTVPSEPASPATPHGELPAEGGKP
jgi:hypothetical protein